MPESTGRARPLVGYFMHVELLVRDADAPRFEHHLAEFLRGSRRPFARLDPGARHELVLALKSSAALDFPRAERGAGTTSRSVDARVGERVIRYVHLWQLFDAADLDLSSIMIRSADDSAYMAVNALVCRETQDFVRLVQRPGASAPRLAGPRCVRVVRGFRSRQLAAYLFRSGALLPALSQRGYRLLAQLQNVTGPLNTVTELWEPERPEATAERLYDLGGVGGEACARLARAVEHELPLWEQRELLVVPAYFAALAAAA